MGSLAAVAPAEVDSLAALRPSDVESAPAQLAGDELTQHALDIPPKVRLGPRVEHVDMPRDGNIAEVLSEALALPQVCCLSCTAFVVFFDMLPCRSWR